MLSSLLTFFFPLLKLVSRTIPHFQAMGKSLWVVSLIVAVFGLAMNVSLHDTVYVSISFAILAGVITWKTLPRLAMTFINAHVSGVDVLKTDRPLL